MVHARWVAPLFALFGIVLAVSFFINGTGMDPNSAIQQQVQYLSWIISAAGWIIVALSFIMGLLYQILRELKQPGSSSAPTTAAVTSPGVTPAT